MSSYRNLRRKEKQDETGGKIEVIIKVEVMRRLRIKKKRARKKELEDRIQSMSFDGGIRTRTGVSVS